MNSLSASCAHHFQALPVSGLEKMKTMSLSSHYLQQSMNRPATTPTPATDRPAAPVQTDEQAFERLARLWSLDIPAATSRKLKVQGSTFEVQGSPHPSSPSKVNQGRSNPRTRRFNYSTHLTHLTPPPSYTLLQLSTPIYISNSGTAPHRGRAGVDRSLCQMGKTFRS